MDDWMLMIVFFGIGLLIMVAEVFLPSHGILTLAGVGFLAAAAYQAFQHGQAAGFTVVLLILILLPTMVIVSVRYWHRTPIGRMISPENPVLTNADEAVPGEKVKKFVGHRGRSLGWMRPVGTCEFDGVRLECVAEYGTIDRGTEVIGVDVRGGDLVVRPADISSESSDNRI